MLDQILQGIMNIEQAVQSGGEGLNQQINTLQGSVNTPGASVAPGLNMMDRFHLIQDVVIRQATPSFIVPVSPLFSSVFMTYNARTDRAAQKLDGGIATQYNGDTGTNYQYQYIIGNNTTVSQSSFTSQSKLFLGQATGAAATANYFGRGMVWWSNLHDKNHFPMYLALTGLAASTATADFYLLLVWGQWKSAAGVDAMKIFSGSGDNFIAGSRFTFWGLR